LEDEILALQMERVRYHQTFLALNKSKDAHTMVARSLGSQSDKQLTHIKQLHEREKNLQHQMVKYAY
jgi:E3 ubiquitin-protein ligase BRE1